MKKFSIKFAKKEDVQGIADLYNGWSEFKAILPEDLVAPESVDDLSKYFNGSDTSRIYVVAKTEDNKIVGICYIEKSFKSLKTIRLGNMLVKKDFRGQGVGTALIDKVIEYAKKNSIKKIWLWTQEELLGAIKLYEKKSFKLEGKQKAQFCGKDALLYGLVLN